MGSMGWTTYSVVDPGITQVSSISVWELRNWWFFCLFFRSSGAPQFIWWKTCRDNWRTQQWQNPQPSDYLVFLVSQLTLVSWRLANLRFQNQIDQLKYLPLKPNKFNILLVVCSCKLQNLEFCYWEAHRGSRLGFADHWSKLHYLDWDCRVLCSLTHAKLVSRAATINTNEDTELLLLLWRIINPGTLLLVSLELLTTTAVMLRLTTNHWSLIRKYLRFKIICYKMICFRLARQSWLAPEQGRWVTWLVRLQSKFWW